MPRRATRSANCHRDVADSSVALPKDRMPWAYSDRASSHRRRSSTSPSGKRRLRATESGTCKLMLMTLLRVYAVGPPSARPGRRVGPQVTCLHWWGGLQPANARLRAHSFPPLKGMGASRADNGETTAYNRRAPQLPGCGLRGAWGPMYGNAVFLALSEKNRFLTDEPRVDRKSVV